MAKTVYADSREKASETVAAALADGVDPDAISEAISLAGTMLVLGDPGRKKEWSSPGKPEGSVHGDSVGVHASDAANGWRHIAKVASARNTFASLIAAAYHTAGQASWQMSKPYPLLEDVDNVFHGRENVARKNGKGVFINHEASRTSNDCYVCEIPPGQSLAPQQTATT